MLDRTQAPDFQSIKKVAVTQAHSKELTNGVKLHWVNAGEQPAIRLEYIFAAGSWYEPSRGVSYFTAKMLNEGTHRRSSGEISEYIDQFGSFLELSQNAERIILTVYTITKHLSKLLPLVHELLTESIFPEKELDNLKTITSQNLQVNLQKTSFLAQHRFRELIFGENHPYGKYIKDTDIAPVTKDLLVQYHQQAILQRPFDAVLSGQITDEALLAVEQHLSQFDVQKTLLTKPTLPVAEVSKHTELIERPESVQSTIRFGKRLLHKDGTSFTRRSSDYFSLVLLNEVLGGYFGSRLMKNIREDKGFTYGIHSSLGIFRKEGFIVIGTDVKKEFTNQTLEEIRKEITLLQTEPIPDEELETVKNYILGAFAGSVTTPFSLADHFKTIYFEGIGYDFYDKYVTEISQTTSETLLSLAQQYLNLDTFTEVVAGGK
ncbi:pitrilysin family protein [Cytophagaceae bacterium DM2B3-1]|uniref:Pitrilysin family protein n=1 Tax=Xanthocytophaga flava TaxID=3048013 RepID=A0ABT7CZB1_9BACT|nr:pitrilysin family protein [Xanthocytophaga flavus]MDJ1468562.1 pitrilysin family protein [Xanthocytophaga flavus]MDJ1498831.1 pitrilysin family protein [Xanthocytophaga flavus]